MAENCQERECKRPAEVTIALKFPAGEVSIKAFLDLRLCPQHGGLFSVERFLAQGYGAFLKRHFEQLGLPQPSLEAVSSHTRPLKT